MDSSLVRRIYSLSRFFLVRLLLFSTFRHFAFHSVNTFFFDFFSLKIEAKEKVRNLGKDPKMKQRPRNLGTFRRAPASVALGNAPPGRISVREGNKGGRHSTYHYPLFLYFVLFLLALFLGKTVFRLFLHSSGASFTLNPSNTHRLFLTRRNCGQLVHFNMYQESFLSES